MCVYVCVPKKTCVCVCVCVFKSALQSIQTGDALVLGSQIRTGQSRGTEAGKHTGRQGKQVCVCVCVCVCAGSTQLTCQSIIQSAVQTVLCLRDAPCWCHLTRDRAGYKGSSHLGRYAHGSLAHAMGNNAHNMVRGKNMNSMKIARNNEVFGCICVCAYVYVCHIGHARRRWRRLPRALG